MRFFLGTVVLPALVALMIIGASQAKPQNNGVDQDAINGLSPDQLINLLQGNGNIDVSTSPPLPKQSNGQCTCVPLQSCCDPGPGESTTSGSIGGAPIIQGIVDPRIAPNQIIDVNDRQNIICENALTVCCNTMCSTPKPPVVRPPTSGECGIRNLNGIDVTIEGFQDRQAQLGEFPWMVAVLDQGTNYVGGGSLVHSKIVLTAAHKVHDIKSGTSLVARIGDWDLSTTNEPIPNQNINVARVLFHPEWDRSTLVNDVALLILQKDATLGPTVRPICMPSKFDKFDGSNCIVTGWGKDVFGAEGRFQQIMKEVTVPAVSHSECQRMLRNTRLGSEFFLHNTFNCAGANGEDACDGDGGSPLVCPDPSNPSRYVQMGVVAWGIGCGQVGNPGVYGSIPATVEWINENIRNEGSAAFDIRTGQ